MIRFISLIWGYSSGFRIRRQSKGNVSSCIEGSQSNWQCFSLWLQVRPNQHLLMTLNSLVWVFGALLCAEWSNAVASVYLRPSTTTTASTNLSPLGGSEADVLLAHHLGLEPAHAQDEASLKNLLESAGGQVSLGETLLDSADDSLLVVVDANNIDIDGMHSFTLYIHTSPFRRLSFDFIGCFGSFANIFAQMFRLTARWLGFSNLYHRTNRLFLVFYSRILHLHRLEHWFSSLWSSRTSICTNAQTTRLFRFRNRISWRRILYEVFQCSGRVCWRKWRGQETIWCLLTLESPSLRRTIRSREWRFHSNYFGSQSNFKQRKLYYRVFLPRPPTDACIGLFARIQFSSSFRLFQHQSRQAC